MIEIPTCAGDVGSLVIGAADGDNRAWQRLVMRFSGLVASVTGAHGLDAGHSAQVSAAVWLRLGGSLGRIRRPDRIGVWLGAVTRDECIKALRTGARHTLSVPPVHPAYSARDYSPEVTGGFSAKIA